MIVHGPKCGCVNCIASRNQRSGFRHVAKLLGGEDAAREYLRLLSRRRAHLKLIDELEARERRIADKDDS